MSKNYRDECLAKYNDLYTRFYHDESDRFKCFYCGQQAHCFDHQPPITRVNDYRSLHLSREIYIKVPSCNHCNSIAGDELTETLWDRHYYIKQRLAEKNKHLLRGWIWEDHEMRPLGRNLKSYIKKKNAETRILFDRLDYEEGIQAYADSIDEESIERREF